MKVGDRVKIIKCEHKGSTFYKKFIGCYGTIFKVYDDIGCEVNIDGYDNWFTPVFYNYEITLLRKEKLERLLK